MLLYLPHTPVKINFTKLPIVAEFNNCYHKVSIYLFTYYSRINLMERDAFQDFDLSLSLYREKNVE